MTLRKIRAKLSDMSKLKEGCKVRGGYIDERGRFVCTDDSELSYVIRRGKGLSTVAPMLRFSRMKPRYRRYRGLLVMAQKPGARAKKAGQRALVLDFPVR